MAKIAKLTLYIHDPNCDDDDLSETVRYLIEEKSDMYVDHMEAEEKQFKWEDSLRINYVDCTPEEVKSFFDGLSASEV